MSRTRAFVAAVGTTATILALGGAADARRLVPAEPYPDGRTPGALNKDGTHGPLLIDQDYMDAARKFRAANPRFMPPRGELLQVGEVIVLQGDDQTVATSGTGWAVRSLGGVARRVIEHAGDNFDFITVWLTFDDKASPMAGAYESTIKQDVAGIGIGRFDRSSSYGSNGVLRSMMNMKSMPYGSIGVSGNVLEVWGQESAHRWLIFMEFRDPRTGKNSDAILGRDCSHYSIFADTQASIEDGGGWTDMGKDPAGTGLNLFHLDQTTERYGNLDLYGMGLMAADEMPSFYLIDEIPGYVTPRCGSSYESAKKPIDSMKITKGKRIDIGIDDIVAANGVRLPTADQVNGYYREAEVILTTPDQNPADLAYKAEWMNKARVQWEDWNRPASQHRQVICTKISADCGDPRSDVVRAEAKPNVAGAVIPGMGPLTFEIEVKNTGGRGTTNVKTKLDVAWLDQTFGEEQDIGDLPIGESQVRSFKVDLKGAACGTEIHVKGSTQSEYHYHRLKQTLFPGLVTNAAEGFETEGGWTVDPDGDDTSLGARWERGTPERTEVLRTEIQPKGAHGGDAAWVTGASRKTEAWVRQGKTTLQSTPFDLGGLRDPMLRYWVSFSSVRAKSADELELSPDGSLTVLGKIGGDWLEIDKLERLMTSGWKQRNIRLPEALRTGKLTLRFVAEDKAAAQSAVEAAVDDIEIASNVPQCYGSAPEAGGMDASDGGTDGGAAGSAGGGCGCVVPSPFGPAHATASASAAWLILALLARRARRRR